MIGYYVHHHGRGHLQRARAVAEAWSDSGPVVTGLSSLPRPTRWPGSWVQLPPDDCAHVPIDATAGSQLHWAPLGDLGVQARASALSRWIEQTRPRAVVVDVSVETALIARLHGLPVVSMVLPGRRADTAHLTGFRVSSALVAAWPEPAAEAGVDFAPGLPPDIQARIMRIGAISRFPVCDRPQVRRYCRSRPVGHAVLLQGSGGAALWQGSVEDLERRTPGWSWKVLGGDAPWVENPDEAIMAADVVVTTAGESSLADVAALRRPAVVVPTPRPYDEQHVTATALAVGPWPAVVVAKAGAALRSEVLDRAAALDGGAWRTWCDGSATRRLREIVESISIPAAKEHRGATA